MHGRVAVPACFGGATSRRHGDDGSRGPGDGAGVTRRVYRRQTDSQIDTGDLGWRLRPSTSSRSSAFDRRLHTRAASTGATGRLRRRRHQSAGRPSPPANIRTVKRLRPLTNCGEGRTPHDARLCARRRGRSRGGASLLDVSAVAPNVLAGTVLRHERENVGRVTPIARVRHARCSRPFGRGASHDHRRAATFSAPP